MPQINIRWSDNTKDLAANLKQGLNQIEATRASAEKMAKALGGENLIRAAHNYAAAVQQVGGANKLTAAEQARVNDLLTKALAKYEALGKEAPQALRDLAAATKQADTNSVGFGSTLGKLNGLLGGLGLGLSVGAAVSFGKAIMADADALVRLSDKTGVTIEGLQRLQVVGDDAGNSIDDITGAITKLQDNLAGGNKSALAALERLGLTLADIQDMSPDQQFIAISDALRQIEDPAQQVNIAIDLFGRTGASVLPTLKKGFDDVRDSVVGMSDETARALDEAGDHLAAWWRRAKGLAAEGMVFTARVLQAGGNFQLFMRQATERATQEQAAALAAVMGRVQSPAAFSGTPATSFPVPDSFELEMLNNQLDAQREAMNEAAEAATKLAAEIEKFDQNTRDVIASATGFNTVLDTIDGTVLQGVRYYEARGVSLDRLGVLYGLTKVQVEALSQAFKFESDVAALNAKVHVGLGTELDKVGATTVNLASKAMPQFDASMVGAAAAAGNLATRAATLGQTLKAGLFDILKSIPETLAAAFTGGGNLLGAAQSLVSQIGASVGRGLGKTVGFLGSFGGPIGAAVGSLLGPLVGAFGKLFDDPEKQINPIREAFVQAAGGLHELNVKAKEAGVTLDKLLDAKNPREYEAAIRDLNAALEFQASAMRTLDETIKKYGFSIEELGPALSRQKLDEQAQQLFQDFKVLTTAGIDVDAVLGRMGDSINQFVADALRTGSEIPAAMAPMLQRMVELGQLTDANGNVITDLEAAGVSFAMTMSEGFKGLIDEVKRLTDAIARGLGLAIESIPDPEIRGRVTWDVEEPRMPRIGEDVTFGSRGGRVTDGGIIPQYFADGGPVLSWPRLGSDTVAAMLTPGEIVLNAAQQANVADAVAGAQPRQPLHVHVNMDRREVAHAFIDNVLRDEAGMRRVIQKVAGA